MTILGRALLLAGAALPLANFAAAQTIKQDGQVIGKSSCERVARSRLLCVLTDHVL